MTERTLRWYGVAITTHAAINVHGMTRFTGTATLLLLIVAGVPWYWRFLPQTGNEIWMGMPAWFVVSVAVSFFVSTATAIQFLVPWPGEADELTRSRAPRTGTEGDDETGNAESVLDVPRDYGRRPR